MAVKRFSLLCLLGIACVQVMHLVATGEPKIDVVKAASAPTGNTFESAYTIRGLPQQDFLLNQNYNNGIVHAIRFEGTRGYIIEPTKAKDSKRRWIWVSPLWTAFNSPTWGDTFARTYVERALDKGFYVVGVDVGTTCGSLKGAELYERFYLWIVPTYGLNPRVRMIGVSNGGLISYAWAFRHPDHVEKILGIYPATDMRTWPKLENIAGGFPAYALSHPYTSVAELEAHLDEVNPIANLEPLAKAGVRIFHVHGDKDDLVPLEPNSAALKRRYLALGGSMQLDVFKGEAHGGNAFFKYEPALEFLVGD
jgi:hypothetical protein